MPRSLFRQLTRTSFALFLSLAVDAPIAGAQATLADWDLICFCNSRVSTPHFVVRMDGNGALLYAARMGVTREQLTRAGVPATSTAIQLLRDWGLPEHERETRFYSRVLNTGENPLWREDLMNNSGTPIIGLGARSAESLRRVQEGGGKIIKATRGTDGTYAYAAVQDPVGACLALVAG